jgi:hypothetical protein
LSPSNQLLDWLLLQPVTRRLRGLRTELRVFRYVRRKAIHVDLADAEPVLGNAVIGMIAFNRPDLLEWQVCLVRRHLAQAGGYVVFDNSPSESARQKIRAVCTRQRIPYVGLPRNIFQGLNHNKVMLSHGSAVNWACRNFIAKLKPAVFGFLDHDIFPTEPFDARSKLEGQPVYGLRLNSTSHEEAWALWPGYCFFDGSKVDAAKLDFNPGFGMTTGGRNWPLLGLATSAAEKAFAERGLLHIGSGTDMHEDFFETIDGWLHAGNASSWRGSDVAAMRQDALHALLRAAAGADAPAAMIEPL